MNLCHLKVVWFSHVRYASIGFFFLHCWLFFGCALEPPEQIQQRAGSVHSSPHHGYINVLVRALETTLRELCQLALTPVLPRSPFIPQQFLRTRPSPPLGLIWIEWMENSKKIWTKDRSHSQLVYTALQINGLPILWRPLCQFLCQFPSDFPRFPFVC